MTQERIFQAAVDAVTDSNYEELEKIISEVAATGQKLQEHAENLSAAIGALAAHKKLTNADDTATRIDLAKRIIDIFDVDSLRETEHVTAFSGVLNSRGNPENLETCASIEITKHMIAAGFKVEDLTEGKDAFQVVAEQSSLNGADNVKIADQVDLAVATLLLETGKVPGLEGEKGGQVIEAIKSGKCRLRNFVEDLPHGTSYIKKHEERGEFLEAIISESAPKYANPLPTNESENPTTEVEVRESRSLMKRFLSCLQPRN